MEISTYLQEDINVFELKGKLDVNTSPKVQEEVLGHIVSGYRMVLDMHGCDYVSSAGLRVLLVIAKQLAKVGGQGVLIGLLEEVRDVMEMTGFDNIFKSFDDFNSALTALQEGE